MPPPPPKIEIVHMENVFVICMYDMVQTNQAAVSIWLSKRARMGLQKMEDNAKQDYAANDVHRSHNKSAKIRMQENETHTQTQIQTFHFKSLAFSVFMNKLITSCNSHELRANAILLKRQNPMKKNGQANVDVECKRDVAKKKYQQQQQHIHIVKRCVQMVTVPTIAITTSTNSNEEYKIGSTRKKGQQNVEKENKTKTHEMKWKRERCLLEHRKRKNITLIKSIPLANHQ